MKRSPILPSPDYSGFPPWSVYLVNCGVAILFGLVAFPFLLLANLGAGIYYAIEMVVDMPVQAYKEAREDLYGPEVRK